MCAKQWSFLLYKFDFFLQMATDFPNDHNANGNEPNMLSIKNIPSRIVTTSSQVKRILKMYEKSQSKMGWRNINNLIDCALYHFQII